ncbi:MAG TPA: hypothetical protein VGJ50_32915 [Streptosporangiaceae bacterium]|jgi:hypothetical protein
MRNRFKRASYAVAAGVTVAATVGMSAMAASAAPVRPAATSACSFHCVDVSFRNPGPFNILTVHSGIAEPNNIVRLTHGSNGASKQDFSRINVGTVGGVGGLYCTTGGLSLDQTIFTNKQCKLLSLAGLYSATTFQLAFNPNNGGDETLCLGAWDNQPPVSGFKTRLSECGVAADTVLIQTGHIPGGSVSGLGDWLINGASDNFSNPLVATSDGTSPSQPTWSTVRLNGKRAIDTQVTRQFPGPF